MRAFASILIVICSALCGLGFLYLIGRSGDLFDLSSKLRTDSVVTTYNEYMRYRMLINEGKKRALIYEDEIEKNHLYLGMVANRDHDGVYRSECDSLLFSSLRYVALKKLGFMEKANKAWQAIATSNEGGKWYRHPKCRGKSTSRDMIVGLLAALSQKPENLGQYLQELISYIRSTGGYIGNGPFHVSRVSPGLAEIIRIMAISEGMDIRKLPPHIRYSFSTIEFSAFSPVRGYTSHLSGLIVWLEYELLGNTGEQDIRSVTQVLDKFVKPFTKHSLRAQRGRWVAQKLVESDSKNLFFKWLRLRSIGALTEKTKADLLTELLSMPQFPKERLPQNCDRKADYLWQRDSREYVPFEKDCLETYSGVDFLWMLALLSETD